MNQLMFQKEFEVVDVLSAEKRRFFIVKNRNNK